MSPTGEMMSIKLELHAQTREDVGKGASRRLRRQGERIPGILYGGGAEPVKLTLENRELSKAMMNEVFFSQIIDLSVDGTSEQVILRDLQRNPSNDKVMHIDLLRIRADRELQVSVPLHFMNEDRCVGVRLEGGSISHLLNEVEITCLPKDLPEYIEVYMAELKLGEMIHLSDLAVPEGINVVALDHGDDRPVVTVLAPRVASEQEEEVEAAAGEEAADEEGGDESSDD
jgi:large subunit ribosomal protein L25